MLKHAFAMDKIFYHLKSQNMHTADEIPGFKSYHVEFRPTLY